jgi:hypothetical protein
MTKRNVFYQQTFFQQLDSDVSERRKCSAVDIAHIDGGVSTDIYDGKVQYSCF